VVSDGFLLDAGGCAVNTAVILARLGVRTGLVGKVDALADRKAGALAVHAVHQDVPFTAAMTAEIDQEIAALADWLELDLRRQG